MQAQIIRPKRLCFIFCAVLTLVLAWRWQRIFYLECVDYIISDVPSHIRLALGRNDYGLSSYIIRLLWSLGGEHFGQTALSLLLAANQLFGILTLWLLLRAMFPELPGSFAWLAALLSHLCGPWILPGQTEMYLGAYNGNVLHNMTMLFSRSLIPLDLLFFYRLWDRRGVGLCRKDWLAFALCLLVTTLFKPSFLGAFAPAVFVLLVLDFLRTKARGFRSEFLIGAAVIPSLLALVWSSLVLFSDDFAGTSSGVTLRALTLPVLAGMLVMYLRGALLPVWSFTLQGPRETAQREHLGIFAWVFGVSVAEAVVLAETGFRANDGNFSWGCLSLYTTLFSIAIALLFRMLPAADAKKEEKLRFAVGLVLLLGHLIIGVYCLHRPGHAGYDWCWF